MIKKTGTFILLKKVRYGEADLIITGISSEGEKKSFLARSALKSRKRFGGGILEPLHHVKLIYSDKSDKHQLSTLEEAQLLNDFAAIKTDYDLLQFGLFAVECAAKVSQEGDSLSDSLYNLLGHCLKNISSQSFQQQTHLPILKIQFFLKLLADQGVLEQDVWMRPFLHTPLSDFLKLVPQASEAKERISYVEKVVREYLSHAQLS
ncbi:MAG: DNA repair protein RecO [Bdellovibrionaceae bacterium]|nr:DNA repair protein RecO [Pseudobdellovibrionaceae bacterium]